MLLLCGIELLEGVIDVRSPWIEEDAVERHRGKRYRRKKDSLW